MAAWQPADALGAGVARGRRFAVALGAGAWLLDQPAGRRL